MNVLIAGGSGLIGQSLIPGLLREGHTVHLLSRNASSYKSKFPNVKLSHWEPEKIILDKETREPLKELIEKTNVMINLAGSSISEGRLDPVHAQRVRESRLLATNALLQVYHQANKKPQVWLQASAIGYYGDRGDEEIVETSACGKSILSKICLKWEETLLKSTLIKKTRVSVLRIGMVLSQEAKAWRKILLPIKLGVGGPLGSGAQWYSWIHIDDLVEAVLFLSASSSREASGVFNLTAPEPIRQMDMARLIGKKVRRPVFIPTPAFALRILLGNLADELVLSSCRIIPQNLLGLDFRFRYPDFSSALNKLCE